MTRYESVDRSERAKKPKVAGIRPGYSVQLPKIFPYKRDISMEEGFSLIKILTEAEVINFALVTHPLTVDGHVTLWLSEEAASFLVREGHIASVVSTKVRDRRAR